MGKIVMRHVTVTTTQLVTTKMETAYVNQGSEVVSVIDLVNMVCLVKNARGYATVTFTNHAITLRASVHVGQDLQGNLVNRVSLWIKYEIYSDDGVIRNKLSHCVFLKVLFDKQ